MWISCVILVLAAGGYALWPLFAKTLDENAENAESAGSPTETDADYLAARKIALYRNIKELEFDYKMGRLAEADFRKLETEYKGEAAEILQKLEILKASSAIEKPPALSGTRAECPQFSEHDDETSRVPMSADVCPACGAKTIPGKKFCADCGARL